MPAERRWFALGERLRAERERRDLTRRSLAHLLEVSCSGYAMIERGECPPELRHLPVLADALELLPDELLRLAGYEAPAGGAGFLLVPLHQAEYKRLIAPKGTSLDTAPPAWEIACPRCGLLYVAGPSSADVPASQAHALRAVGQLEQECPDHVHRFAIDG